MAVYRFLDSGRPDFKTEQCLRVPYISQITLVVLQGFFSGHRKSIKSLHKLVHWSSLLISTLSCRLAVFCAPVGMTETHQDNLMFSQQMAYLTPNAYRRCLAANRLMLLNDFSQLPAQLNATRTGGSSSNSRRI